MQVSSSAEVEALRTSLAESKQEPAVVAADPAEVAEIRARGAEMLAEIEKIRIQNEELLAQLKTQEASQTVQGQTNLNFRNLYNALNKARRFLTLFQTLQQHQEEVGDDEMMMAGVGSKRKRTE